MESPLLDDELSPLNLECVPGSTPEATESIIKGLVAALIRQAKILREIWPAATHHAKAQFPELTETYKLIKAHNAPNFKGASIPVVSDLNIPVWEAKLSAYYDVKLCQFLKFSWPLGYHLDVPPATVTDNHPSALNNMAHVRDFIEKELNFKAILSPFDDIPFDNWCRISPMMTRPKKGSDDRRIILDLSYPRGVSVNDGISTKDHYGRDITYSLPTIADFIEILKCAGTVALMWKSDLTRAYRQLRVDQLDAPLLGMMVEGKVYIDLCLPFGCRSSAAICQRVANALVFMMLRLGFSMIAYLDDFATCCPTRRQADSSFQAFNNLMSELGLKPTTAYRPPTTSIEWLGYTIDSDEMKVSMTNCSK